MTREKFHDMIDQQLDAMGFSDNVNIAWGSIVVQVNFEKGEEVLEIRERHLKK